MKRLLLALGFVLSLSPLSASAVLITLDPSDVGPVNIGDTIFVNIIASGLADGEVITAFDMAVSFDNTVLSLDSILYSTALGDPPCNLLDFAPPCDNAQALFDASNIEGPGFADPNLFSLLTDLTDLLALQGPGWNGILATLSFTANASASQVGFQLVWTGINDVKCNNARKPSNLDYVCFPVDSTSDIPEPAALSMLSLGLLIMGLRRRRTGL